MGLSRCEEVASTCLDPLNAHIFHRTDRDSNEDGETYNYEKDSDNDKTNPLRDDMQAQYTRNWPYLSHWLSRAVQISSRISINEGSILELDQQRIVVSRLPA